MATERASSASGIWALIAIGLAIIVIIQGHMDSTRGMGSRWPIYAIVPMMVGLFYCLGHSGLLMILGRDRDCLENFIISRSWTSQLLAIFQNHDSLFQPGVSNVIYISHLLPHGSHYRLGHGHNPSGRFYSANHQRRFSMELSQRDAIQFVSVVAKWKPGIDILSVWFFYFQNYYYKDKFMKLKKLWRLHCDFCY